MALDHARVLDRNRALGRIHGQHAPRLSAVAPGHHAHLVALLDSGSGRSLFHSVSHRAHHTSGASETIFANFFSRSSRATGPKTRVPTGSLASLMSTAALSSNRIYVPSLRRCSLRVRTTTARTTLPFLIGLSGVASFTEAVIISPRPARLPTSPPTGRIHIRRRAPELSATGNQLRI